MARKAAAPQVVVDPVALAAQLEQGKQGAAPEPMAAMTGPDAETERGRSLPAAESRVSLDLGAPGPDVSVPQRSAAQCPIGHVNADGTRFCGECGLAMDGQAPVKANINDARPRPVSELSDAERTERDRKHGEALAAARAFDSAPVTYVPSEGEAVTIHFVEDGFTFAGQVWYRGQEIEIGPGHPRWDQARLWILMTKYEQVDRYGKQYFDRGPWPGRRSYTDGEGSFEQLYAGRDGDGKLTGQFAGPGADALRQADEAERRRGRAVPAPLG